MTIKPIVIFIILTLFIYFTGCTSPIYTGDISNAACNNIGWDCPNTEPPNAPESAVTASETLVLSKDLTSSDIQRDFPQDWGKVTYDLIGGGTYHIIVKTTGTEDAAIVQIAYQEKWNVDKFGNINYNPVNKYVGRADKFSDLDLQTTFPQDSKEQTIILIVQGQNGIVSLNVYKVV